MYQMERNSGQLRSVEKLRHIAAPMVAALAVSALGGCTAEQSLPQDSKDKATQEVAIDKEVITQEEAIAQREAELVDGLKTVFEQAISGDISGASTVERTTEPTGVDGIGYYEVTINSGDERLVVSAEAPVGKSDKYNPSVDDARYVEASLFTAQQHESLVNPDNLGGYGKIASVAYSDIEEESTVIIGDSDLGGPFSNIKDSSTTTVDKPFDLAINAAAQGSATLGQIEDFMRRA